MDNDTIGAFTLDSESRASDDGSDLYNTVSSTSSIESGDNLFGVGSENGASRGVYSLHAHSVSEEDTDSELDVHSIVNFLPEHYDENLLELETGSDSCSVSEEDTGSELGSYSNCVVDDVSDSDTSSDDTCSSDEIGAGGDHVSVRSTHEPVCNTCEVMEMHVTKHQQDAYVLQQVHEKLQSGSSREELERRLKGARLLGFDIPCKWNKIIIFLKRLGYSAPRHFKVCITDDHSVAFTSDSASTCPRPNCSKASSDYIDYFVMGMSFENWFDTEEKCERLLSHWRDKDEWFNKSPLEDIDMIELWHGGRFRELSYFWDSTVETLYPFVCTKCNKVVPTAHISAASGFSMGSEQQLSVTCPHCHEVQVVLPKYARGDPRNQAIFLHYDGWNPQSTSAKHGIASISIAKGCMQKSERAGNKEVQVYSFIPTNQLPRDCPHKYDGFLQPLLEDICNLYIDGKSVHYAKSDVPGVASSTGCVLRAIPLLFTADMKAHAEIGLVKSGGYSACRRCTVHGVHCNGSVHYGNFQYRFVNPCSKKTAEQNRTNGRKIDSNLTSDNERSDLMKHSGVTGESPLYILYDLCGFDPIKDAVIDVMHALPLNLVATELKGRLLADPSKGGVLKVKNLSKALDVPWTTELRDGRVPEAHNDNIGFWKAEQYNKFALVAPFVLRKIIPDENYRCFALLSAIRNMIYSFSLRVVGWRQGNVQVLHKLLWKHAILYENLYSFEHCTENLECSLHIPDDILRHSSPDNYWCYIFERLVSFHKQQKTNKKSFCKTLADRCHQLDFVELHLKKLSKCPSVVMENDVCASNFSHFANADLPQALHASSKEIAMNLFYYVQNSLDVPNNIKAQLEFGIMLRSGTRDTLEPGQKDDVSFWLQKFNPSAHVNVDEVLVYKAFLKEDENNMLSVFRTNEAVVIQDHVHNDKEWVAVIKKIFCIGPVSDHYYCFFDADFYVPKESSSGCNVKDSWSGEDKLHYKKYNRRTVQPTKYVKRKIMLKEYVSRQENFSLSIDPNPPIETNTVISVPPCPCKDDYAKFVDHGKCIGMLKVTDVSVNGPNKVTVTGLQLDPVGNGGKRWKRKANCRSVHIELQHVVAIPRCSVFGSNVTVLHD